MRKIVTITANTAIDKLIEVENFKIGGVYRSEKSSVFPSGKGINSAKVIASLGSNVIGLGFVGESSRKDFDTLNGERLKVDLLEVGYQTRINITIYDPVNKTETHVRESGFKVNDQDIHRLIARIEEYVLPGDVVILSGSLPGGIPPTTYKMLIEVCNQLKSIVILDSSHEELRFGILARPYMIKPNIEEFRELVNEDVYSEFEIIAAARKISSYGIPLVVVSRGKEGVIVFDNNNDQVFKAHLFIEEPIMTHIGIGSGDALVGGFAVGLLNNLTLVQTIRLGVAAGAANLLTIGPSVCNPNDIIRFAPNVRVESLNESGWHAID